MPALSSAPGVGDLQHVAHRRVGARPRARPPAGGRSRRPAATRTRFTSGPSPSSAVVQTATAGDPMEPKPMVRTVSATRSGSGRVRSTRLGRRLHAPPQHLGQQVVLPREVRVRGRRGHARPLGDRPHRDVAVGPLLGLLGRRGQQPLHDLGLALGEMAAPGLLRLRRRPGPPRRRRTCSRRPRADRRRPAGMCGVPSFMAGKRERRRRRHAGDLGDVLLGQRLGLVLDDDLPAAVRHPVARDTRAAGARGGCVPWG